MTVFGSNVPTRFNVPWTLMFFALCGASLLTAVPSSCCAFLFPSPLQRIRRPSRQRKSPAYEYQQQQRRQQKQRQQKQGILFVASIPSEAESSNSSFDNDHHNHPTDDQRRPCFYRSPAHNNKWRPRLELSDLTIGQPLNAVVVQELLDGQTGPKVFCEVGVGRWRCRKNNNSNKKGGDDDDRQQWKIVYAMLRLGNHRGTKKSVVAKKAARLRKKKEKGFPVVVSKIRLDNDQLEVCFESELPAERAEATKISVSSLTVGQEVNGTVVRVEPFGVLIDVGANRHGLLHITKVSKFMNRFIDKEDGLREAGLTKGAQVMLKVDSNQKKRLFLDFTDSVKEMASKQQQKTKKPNQQRQHRLSNEEIEATANSNLSPGAAAAASSSSLPSSSLSNSYVLSAEEEAAWAAYAALNASATTVASSEAAAVEDEDVEDEEDYDEDRDIEDAFGLGTY